MDDSYDDSANPRYKQLVEEADLTQHLERDSPLVVKGMPSLVRSSQDVWSQTTWPEATQGKNVPSHRQAESLVYTRFLRGEFTSLCIDVST